MKITKVIKKCQAEAQKAWEQNAMPGPKEGFVCGLATGYDSCANMLEETVREIQRELGRFRAEAENEELSEAMRADAAAMAVIVEWILGKKNHKGG